MIFKLIANIVMVQKEQLQQLWFKPYDEECFSLLFQQINFSKYILIVLTDPNFDYFQQHAYENKVNWQAANLQFFEFLELLNDYFDISAIDEKIVYIEDKQIKKITGKFRLWIDCQRLYCLQFFGLYHAEFGQDRLTLSLSRSKKALYALLKSYKYEMFEQNQFKQFLMKTQQKFVMIQKNLAQDKKIQSDLINEINYMLSKFRKRQNIFQKDLMSNQLRRIAKQILQRNITQAKQIQAMLLIKLKFTEKITAEKQQILWKEVPTELMKQKYKKPQLSLLEVNNKQDKSSLRKTNKIKSLNKSINNPKDEKNVAFYSNFLSYFQEQQPRVANMQKQNKKNNRQSSNRSSFESSNNDQWYYYDDQFIKKVKNANNQIARITNEDIADLNEKILIKTKKIQEIEPKQLGNKIKDIIWKTYPPEELEQKQNKYKNSESQRSFNKIRVNLEQQNEVENQEDDLNLKNKPVVNKFLYSMQLQKEGSLKDLQKKHKQNKFSIYKEAKLPKYQRIAEVRWGIINASQKKIIALKRIQTTQDLVFWQKIPRFTRFIKKKYAIK